MNKKLQNKALSALTTILAMVSAEWILSGQDTGQNYIEERTYMANDGIQFRSEILYFDGLGRSSETVLKGAWIMDGSACGDIVFRQDYDNSGRSDKLWLPVGIEQGNGNYVSANAFESQAVNYYNDLYPYEKVFYDNSPLDRIKGERGAGRGWFESNSTTTYRYLTNLPYGGDYELRSYSLSFVGNTEPLVQANSVYHPVGTTSVLETTDEDGRRKMVFKDMFGNVLLERLFVRDEAGDEQKADTYYCYNMAGQLIGVFPPMLSKVLKESSQTSFISMTTPAIGQYAYLYRYDDRGRLIARKIPGADWIYYVYDEGDRLVYMQNGVQRNSGIWSFVIKDKQGRDVLSGTVAKTMNAFTDPLSGIEVVATRSYPISENSFYGYTVQGMDVLGFNVKKVSWYDDYSFLGLFDIPAATLMSHTSFNSAWANNYSGPAEYGTGMMTGTMEQILGETDANQYLWEVLYYDDQRRVVQHTRSTHRGGIDRTNIGYSFEGKPIEERIIHVDPETDHKLAEKKTYTYDSWGRPQATCHAIGTWRRFSPIFPRLIVTFADSICLHDYAYDAVGRMIRDNRNGEGSLNTRYSYNIRSWLTDIKVGGNTSQGTQGETYTEKLYYHIPRSTSLIDNRQWGGNISSQMWMTGNDGVQRSYDYVYDDMSRLISATYQDDDNNNGVFDRSYTYDLNGNILSLGQSQSLSTTMVRYNGNQQTYLETPSAPILRSTPNSNPILLMEYEYDANGNLTKDIHRGISLISYNEINRPQRVELGGIMDFMPEEYSYLYSFSGEKLRKQNETILLSMGNGNNHPYTDYVGDLIYQNNQLKTILIDGGYIEIADTTYQYRFYVKDHLGSNRLVTDEMGAILSVNHFGPYGESLSIGGISGADSPYKYNGKEYDRNMKSYDYGARDYAVFVSRWTTIDPLCEKYYSLSPYAYCAGNPVNLVDPRGDDIWEIDSKGYVRSHTKDTTQDAFYLVELDNEGEYVRKYENEKPIGIFFDYGTVEYYYERAYGEGDGEIDTIFQLRGDDNGRALFEFLANNITAESGIEFALNLTGITGEKGLSYISTSHNEHREGSSKRLFLSQLKNGYTMRERTHSHQYQYNPSGVSKSGGDMAAGASINRILQQRGLPKPSYYIYINKMYIPYFP